jgi:gliding motility-associated-like protein
LIKSSPVFIETSVAYTDIDNGSIHLTWMKPTEFDPGIYPGPYKYVIASRQGQVWENFANPVDVLGINDTTYTDSLINSLDFPMSYRVTLYSESAGDWEQVGSPAHSSSLFIEGVPGNKRMTILINDSTPWTNTQYVIYRKPAGDPCETNNEPFDSITTVSRRSYTDQGLVNGNTYQYLVKSIGEYDLDFIPKPLINYSQELCVTPQDTTPPCPVSLTLESDCDLLQNYLTWTVNASCSQDVDDFLIFWSDSYEGAFTLIDTVEDNQVRTYIHQPPLSLGACYVVSARDSAGNYMKPEQLVRVCIDECNYYTLPNVFTPNTDGLNDIFKPYPYKFVDRIDLVIYNRWGNEVFKTNDPDINWDGTDLETGKPVVDGVYYYICDVYERRLSGIEVRNISGLIRIFASKGNKATD